MTQALALAAFLREAGHDVHRVLVGRSPWRSVPEYFTSGIGAPVEAFDAPTQVPDSSREGVSALGTGLDLVRRGGRFVRSVRQIGRALNDADVVVNFLDLLGGVALGMSARRVPALAVAHNHLFLHPDLAGAPGPTAVRRLVLGYAQATATGTVRKLALSFGPMSGPAPSGLSVTPPLLRPGLADLKACDDGFLLAYALNAGYGRQLAAWQRRNPNVTVHCFVDGGPGALGMPDAGPKPQADAGPKPQADVGPGALADGGPGAFQAHDLDDRSFLDHLARCRAFVGSAGFESICEAHYLGKPTLAVPTRGQFEQVLNAWDAERCGAARSGTYADLDPFWRATTPPAADVVQAFRAWVGRGPEIFVDAVERTAHHERSNTPVGDRI